MATRTGYLATSAIASAATPAITTDLQGYAGNGWPGAIVATPRLAGGARTRTFPVISLAAARQGWKTRNYTDDFYYRIHLTPRRLDLGNVASSQTATVRIWNAFLTPKTVERIDGLDEGLSVEGPASLPATLTALSETDWLVRVTSDGPPVLDATLEWIFTGVTAPALVIVGNRIVAWTWAPDWSSGITERLAWATEILRSDSGAEQRRALRIAPRRSFEARVQVEGRERVLLDLGLANRGARVWAVPIWTDIQQLAGALAIGATSIAAQTADRDFRAGGLAVLCGPDAWLSETVQIDSVEPAALVLKRPTLAAWPVGTRLYPARSARLTEQPTLTRRTDRLSGLEVSFLLAEPADWPLALPATLYRGAPVFEARPDESVDLTASWQRLTELLDNVSGLPAVTDTANVGFAVQGHRWLLAGRAEQAAWRSLVYGLRGRQQAVWIPTHADDLQLAAQAAGVTMDIAACGYSRFGLGRTGRRDIRIELTSGQVLYRRITAASELGVDVERLTLDTNLPAAIPVSEAARVSFMALCRQDSDEIELHHVADADGVAQAQVIWRALRDELELAA